MDFPIENCVIFNSYVKLPEGIVDDLATRNGDVSVATQQMRTNDQK